jgi:hypothetical protein
LNAFSQSFTDDFQPKVNFQYSNMDQVKSIVIADNFNYHPAAARKSAYNNRVGLRADATFFNIDTDAAEVMQGTGWSVNFETRGDYRDDFDLIYPLGFFNHNFSVNENGTNDQIDMSTIGAEIKFLLA